MTKEENRKFNGRMAIIVVITAVVTSFGGEWGKSLFVGVKAGISQPETNRAELDRQLGIIRVNNQNSIERDREVMRYADSLFLVHGATISTLSGKFDFIIDYFKGMKQDLATIDEVDEDLAVN